MFLNIKSKIMKQTQKYRQLSLFDDTEEKKAGTPLDQFEAPDQIQQVGTVRCLEHGEQQFILLLISIIILYHFYPNETDSTNLGTQHYQCNNKIEEP